MTRTMNSRDIVAVLLADASGTITNDPAAVIGVFLGELSGMMLTRVHMELMSKADLGRRWTALAEGPCIIDLQAVEDRAREKGLMAGFKKLIQSRVSTEQYHGSV